MAKVLTSMSKEPTSNIKGINVRNKSTRYTGDALKTTRDPLGIFYPF